MMLLAQADGLLLGEDFLPWMVLAFGAAMIAGNAFALVRPPQRSKDEPAEKPPLGRAIVLMVVGAVAAVWGAASLLS